MDKCIKLKAVALLICSGLAGSAIADNNASMNNNRTASATTQTTQRSDAAITSEVNRALTDYAGKVKVSVKGAVVYLTGQLPSDTDYDKVITAAESVQGVSDINVDQLTVKDSSQPLYDTYITAKVKGALIQNDIMGKDIPAWSISVETKDGQVFLSGKIATQQEKQNIMNVVKSVKGVTKVNDQIVIGASDNDATSNTKADEASSKTDSMSTTDNSDNTQSGNSTGY
ncbi:osmotically inducible protein Y (plasmid) [Legionella adelaidensis]|uniref:Osmotically inducible protein Y n=1 Tax=Legionella adelaidensis TaxID=45056 RepID=A0A0W0R1B7_9GAMM|nr:BON domain-containing protein [Legionella adelaidensis]KTC64883.1 osmotically inducible protein Y [Legionella adelaidensis]VEH82946.1 osmotically inducible protein Y [Legionella adelaidensis]